MSVPRTLLLVAPTLVSALLLQAYFWVPTFEEQARGDPGRLRRFISGTLGDASLLNPTLSADTVSSEINQLVFDGLIDRDADLRFRGRLAESWRLSEEAYLVAEPALRLPDGAPATAETLRARLLALARAGRLGPVDEVTALPAAAGPEQATVARPGGAPPVPVTVQRPARVRLTLPVVDQDLFSRIDRALGGYVGRLDPGRYVTGPADLRPGEAATLVPVTEHNPVIVFRLRRGVRFHDGHELDAGDVKFTYETIIDPRNLSPRAPDYEPVKAVEVLGPHEVRIVYRRLFQPGFATWSMGILPEHRLNAAALRAEALALGRDPARYTIRDAGFNRAPIGTGPFRFGEWRTDELIRLTRFPDYWAGAPRLEEYYLRVIPDRVTEELTFYAGTTDEYVAQPHQVARLRQDPRFQVFSAPALAYTYIGYNLRREPFRDVRVRRALGMALDVQAIIDFVLYGQGERTTGPLPKPTDFYDPAVPPLPYDPAGALKLLEDAGYRRNAAGLLQKDGRPLAFTLITNHGNETRRAIMTIAQDAWRRLGITVEALTLEWAVFLKERVNKLDFDAVVLGWTTPLDPDLYQLFHSSQTGPFQLNFAGYVNPRADELLLRIRQEYDQARQVALGRELHGVVAADQPYTFLYVPRATRLLDRKLVRLVGERDGPPGLAPIVPDRVGGIRFHLTEWVKVAQPPTLTAE